MNKAKSKPKALNNLPGNGGFFRALIFGLCICAVVWLVMSLVLSFVMSKQTDSTAFMKVFSGITVAVSLAFGGFAAGKTDRKHAFFASFVLGCTVLGMCYMFSVWFELSLRLSHFGKTLAVVIMLVFPLLGARFSIKQRKNKRYGRKRM